MRNVLVVCTLFFAATSAYGGGCGQECDFIQTGCRVGPDPYLGCSSFGGGCEEFQCPTRPATKSGEQACPAMKWAALATAYGFDTAAERRGFYRLWGVSGLFKLVEDYTPVLDVDPDVDFTQLTYDQCEAICTQNLGQIDVDILEEECTAQGGYVDTSATYDQMGNIWPVSRCLKEPSPSCIENCLYNPYY